MAEYIPTAEDFQPLSLARDAERIDRPSLSYWQDVWRCLGTNTRALISLYIVIGLLMFTLAGPLLWSVDPALQDLEQISQAPNLGRSALVIPDQQPLQEITAPRVNATITANFDKPVQGLRVLGVPHSEGVTLAWDAVPGADAYQLYRHELEPRGPTGIG